MRNQPVRAIETEFAGCRFRSRLEARWAVFFSRLGVRWRYEHQGYELPSGRYLPDFYLPDWGYLGDQRYDVHVEVKGRLDHVSLVRLMRAAIELPGPAPTTACIQPRLLILGEPEPGAGRTHVRLDTQNGRCVIREVFFDWLVSGDDVKLTTKPVGDPVFFSADAIDRLTEDLTIGFCERVTESTHEPRLTVDPDIDDAYRAARSARFEFGESG